MRIYLLKLVIFPMISPPESSKVAGRELVENGELGLWMRWTGGKPMFWRMPQQNENSSRKQPKDKDGR